MYYNIGYQYKTIYNKIKNNNNKKSIAIRIDLFCLMVVGRVKA